MKTTGKPKAQGAGNTKAKPVKEAASSKGATAVVIEAKPISTPVSYSAATARNPTGPASSRPPASTGPAPTDRPSNDTPPSPQPSNTPSTSSVPASPESAALGSPQLLPVYLGQPFGFPMMPGAFFPPYMQRPVYVYNPFVPRVPPPFPYVPPFEQTGPPHFSIDVECSASGPTHNDRIVSQVALVDQNEKIVLNFFVKPTVAVVSTLNPLTGIKKEDLDAGIPLEEGLRMLREAIPKNAVLLGQNILMDIQWLGLVEGQDFASLLDLAGLFRVYNPKYNNYSYHSLQHKIKYLLGGEQYDTHNAATDAIWSVRLFNLFKRIEKDRELWSRCQEILAVAPPTPSFATLNPVIDGVCMGSRRSCSCGAPFFG